MVIRISYKYWYYYIIAFLILFQNILANFSRPMSYIDELVAAFFLFKILLHIFNGGRWDKPVKEFAVCLLLFIMTTGISTILNSRQPFRAEILDLIAMVKYPVSFIGAYLFFKPKELNILYIENYLKALLILWFIYFLMDQAFNMTHSHEYFFSTPIHSSNLGYTHETFMVSNVILVIALSRIYIKTNYKWYALIAFALIFFSCKAKAYIFIAVYFGLVFFNGRNIGKKVLAIATTTLIILRFAMNKILYYWNGTDTITARRAILEKSLIVAKDYFPIGVGFGNYGSYVADTYYPPYYYQYGLDKVWGFFPGDTRFASDHFWPTLLGETGVLGTLLYLAMFMCILRMIRDIKHRESYFAAMIPLIYVFAASTGESAVFNNYGSAFGIVQSYLILYGQKMDNSK